MNVLDQTFSAGVQKNVQNIQKTLLTAKNAVPSFCQIGEVSLTENESGEMIAANDVNKDGKMDFYEFKMMMTSNKQQNESTNNNQEWNHRNTYHSRPYL